MAVSTVRELYGVMAAEGATGGFVVTSQRFTNEAGAFAAWRNIQLMDGNALRQLLSEGRARTAQHPYPMTASERRSLARLSRQLYRRSRHRRSKNRVVRDAQNH